MVYFFSLISYCCLLTVKDVKKLLNTSLKCVIITSKPP